MDVPLFHKPNLDIFLTPKSKFLSPHLTSPGMKLEIENQPHTIGLFDVKKLTKPQIPPRGMACHVKMAACLEHN
jgi:hypothetical protein